MIPRLVSVDAKGLVAFIKEVFGATGTYHKNRPAEMKIGGSVIMVTDAGVREPAPGFLYVYVADADKTYDRALAAGARSLEKPTDQPYEIAALWSETDGATPGRSLLVLTGKAAPNGTRILHFPSLLQCRNQGSGTSLRSGA